MPKSEAIVKLVRHLRLPLLVVAAAILPSCAIYDQDLIDNAIGGDSVVASGGATGGGKGSGGTGGTGGTTTGGNSPDGGMGGEPIGGNSGGDTGGGDTGGAPTGGSSSTGGNSSTGGAPACIDAPGAFTGLGTAKVLDSFDIDWPLLTSEVTAWNENGFWSGAGDDGITLAMSLTPKGDSENWVLGSGYTPYCEDDGYALHIRATGSDDWGLSFAAKFTDPATNVDLSAYDGVAFWARTEASSTLKVAYATAAAPNKDIGVTNVPPLTTKWSQRKVSFPALASSGPDVAFDPTKIAILKFVGQQPTGGDGTIDIWIDNVTFYTDPAE